MEDTAAMDDFIQTELVKKLKEKNKDALEKIIDCYGDKLLKTAYTYMKNEAKAKDIVQKVFIKLYYKINMFREKSSLYTWLYRITINECKSRLRKWSYKNIFYSNKVTEISDMKKSESGYENMPENRVLEKEKKNEVYQIILNLKAKYRIVIVLYYYHELKIKEIAEIVEEKEATIKTRLFRARKKLKKILSEKGRDFSV